MAEYELVAHLRIHFFGLIWFLLSVNDACATVCSDKYSGSSPVVSMCSDGIATGRAVVLDAQTATINDTECACFLTAKGYIALTVYAAQQPGYAGCGSKIDVSFSSPRERFTFNCFASSYNQMDDGSTANFTLLRSTSASLWNYCLVLQISSSDESDSIKMVCSGPAKAQPVSSTLETTVATELTSNMTTMRTMSISSPSLSTTKTMEQLSTDYISSTVSDKLTNEGMPETTLSNSTAHMLSTTKSTTRTLTMSSTTSSTNLTNPTSLHINPFPSTEKETSPPLAFPTTPKYISTTTEQTVVTMNVTINTTVISLNQTQTSAEVMPSTSTIPSMISSGNLTNPTSPHIYPLSSTEKETSPPLALSTTQKYILTTSKETIVTMNVTTSTRFIPHNQTQTSSETTMSTSTIPTTTSSANMTSPTSPDIDPFPSTEKETSPPLALSTTPTTISITSKETIVTDELTTTTTDISPNQTQTKSQLTSPVSSTPNVAAPEMTQITSNIPQVRSTSLKTEPTTDILLSRSTISLVSESSSVTTSVIATPTRTSTSSSSNNTSSTMETTHTSVTTSTTTQTNITSSLKPTVRTTEWTLPSRFSTTLTSATAIPAQTPTPAEPTTSITKITTQNPSSSSSSSSSSLITATSTSLPPSSSSSSSAISPTTTKNTTSISTTTLSTQLPNTTMYAPSPLPPSSSSSSSSQSTTRSATITTSESTAKVSEGATGRNATTSAIEKKEFELLPVVLPAALAGAIIIAFFLFLTFTMVIRHRRTKSYHTGHNGEYHKPIYSETIMVNEGLSTPTGYDNLIYTKNKELQSPSNGAEKAPVQNIYGEKPVNITDHPPTSAVSDEHF